MGLLDKVKAQATAATEMAKDAAAKGQAKMNDAQAKKTADGMLRDLGAAYYATQTGRSTPTTEADMAQLVTSLQAHESEHGQITLAPESAAAGPDGNGGRRRLGASSASSASSSESGRPGLASTPSADGPDAVAGRAPSRRGLVSERCRGGRPVLPCRMSSSPRGGAVW